MSEGLNRWTGIGNCAADADLRQTSSDPVCNFRIGCSESYLDRNKQRQERTEWVSCVLWGKRATALAQYLTRGQRVYVEGALATRTWEKDGVKQYKTEIKVTNVILLGGKRDGGGSRRQDGDERPETEPGGDVGADYYDDGDSIPF